jgi:hypothetical protein
MNYGIVLQNNNFEHLQAILHLKYACVLTIEVLYLYDLTKLMYLLFFFNNNIFLVKMHVTFLLQKPKILMKYFILIFSYIIKILSNNII